MSTEPQRTCPSCGNEFSGTMEFCPVCMLRKALAGGESGKLNLQKLFEDAFSILARLINGNEEYSGDVDRALKSTLLDKDIDRELHTKGRVPSENTLSGIP
jgi:hypothetical protein